MAKGKINEVIESRQAPATHGSKKRYYVDHSVIWDGEKNRPLAKAERTEPGGKRVVETSDKNIQDKLSGLGYKANEVNIRMHNKRPNPHVKTMEQVDKENKV
jgi:hypothetical protein